MTNEPKKSDCCGAEMIFFMGPGNKNWCNCKTCHRICKAVSEEAKCECPNPDICTCNRPKRILSLQDEEKEKCKHSKNKHGNCCDTKEKAILSAIRGSNEDQRKMVEKAKAKDLLENWKEEFKYMDCCQRGCEHSESIGEQVIEIVSKLLAATREDQKRIDAEIVSDYGSCEKCGHPGAAQYVKNMIINQNNNV